MFTLALLVSLSESADASDARLTDAAAADLTNKFWRDHPIGSRVRLGPISVKSAYLDRVDASNNLNSGQMSRVQGSSP